jgi:adenylate cyclase
MSIEGYLASFYNLPNYHYNFLRVLIIAVLMAIVGGSILSSFEVLYFSRKLLKKSLGQVLIIKTFFYLISIFLFTSIATLISLSYIIDKPLFHGDVLNRFLHYLSSPKIWALMTYWSFAVMFALFILHISEKLGQGVLFNYVLGKYHKPKEETRIFMFLDLTSSSTYAEKLGHIKYSRLIQDCFFDLTEVVNKYNVQIYQYVGDEVVLTWQKDNGIENNKCLKTFFAFQQAIKEKSIYYEKEYGLVPEFKAGLNFGFVTIAEVGEMKRELAYHGDAINTASHIRSVCGKHNKKLLISADLLSLLPGIDDDFNIESMGVCQLKGKKNVIGIFSVDEKVLNN